MPPKGQSTWRAVESWERFLFCYLLQRNICKTSSKMLDTVPALPLSYTMWRFFCNELGPVRPPSLLLGIVCMCILACTASPSHSL